MYKSKYLLAPLALAVTLGLASPSISLAAARSASPNVLLMVVDDLSWPDVSTYGMNRVPTPNIDSIAKQGVAFSNGHVAASVSGVSRAALLTGRYPQRFGFTYNLTDGDNKNDGLPVSELTLAERLKPLGYNTQAIGKWHQGRLPQFYPTSRGFDDFYGFLSGETIYVDPQTAGIVTTLTKHEHFPLDRRPPGLEVVSGPDAQRVDNFHRYLTDDFTDRAMSYIDQQSQQSAPFFMYLAYNAPHWPLQVPQRYYDRFSNIKDPLRRTYVAMISALDDNIGKVLHQLEITGQRDNTLIVLVSDNGCPNHFGVCDCSDPFGAGKFTYVEGGTRVPFVMSWGKNLAPQGVVDTLVSTLDIVPTVLHAAAPDRPPPANLDGYDLLQTLKAGKRADDTLYFGQPPVYAVRQGKWKLYVSEDQQRRELYDLSSDRAELKNLANSQPERLEAMSDGLAAWKKTLVKPRWPIHAVMHDVQQCSKPVEWVH